MLFSMTGFGEAAAQIDMLRVGFRIKSVNHRGLDVNIKLPFDFIYLENDLRQLAKKQLLRGRVDVACEIEVLDPAIMPPASLNRARLAELRELCQQMRDEYGVLGELDVNTLVRLPDLTVTRRSGFKLPKEAETLIFETFEKAASNLNASRSKEGEKLIPFFEKSLDKIAATVEELEGMAADRQASLAEELKTRIQPLLDDVECDPVRLHTEIVFQADRLDITEEITRLAAHIERTKQLISSDKRPLGRELEFMVQEQNREVTTIGNKARNQGMANLVVRMKTEYERIREQVMNLE
jgi:uncharacterized protein (TIGR00255 family)